MVQGLIGVEFIFANDNVCDRFLVVLGDGFGYSSDPGTNEHS